MQLSQVELTEQTLRTAFGAFPSGVTAVAGLMPDGRPNGIAASSFTTVSLDPPLVSVCVAVTSTTWPTLRQMRHLGVSVLADNHDLVCRALAAKTGDRFADVEWDSSEDGAVFVAGSALLLDCSIYQEVPAGDHIVVLLRIHALETDADASPLVFHGSRFRQLAG